MAVKITNKRPPSVTKVGRKPAIRKLTPAMVTEACDALALGYPQARVASLLGMNESVFNRILKRTEGAAVALSLAKESGVKKNLSLIHKHAERNWQAAAWLLERCNGLDYAQRTQTNGTGNSSTGSVLIQLVKQVSGNSREALKSTGAPPIDI